MKKYEMQHVTSDQGKIVRLDMANFVRNVEHRGGLGDRPHDFLRRQIFNSSLEGQTENWAHPSDETDNF